MVHTVNGDGSEPFDFAEYLSWRFAFAIVRFCLLKKGALIGFTQGRDVGAPAVLADFAEQCPAATCGVPVWCDGGIARDGPVFLDCVFASSDCVTATDGAGINRRCYNESLILSSCSVHEFKLGIQAWEACSKMSLPPTTNRHGHGCHVGRSLPTRFVFSCTHSTISVISYEHWRRPSRSKTGR